MLSTVQGSANLRKRNCRYKQVVNINALIYNALLSSNNKILLLRIIISKVLRNKVSIVVKGLVNRRHYR